MIYSITEISEKFNLSAHTLRFYEKAGILPRIERDGSGKRIFTEADVRWLELVECFKETGMPLKEIRIYLELCKKGDRSLKKRCEIMLAHKNKMEQELEKIKKIMTKIDYKILYYQTAISVGSEKKAQKILAGKEPKIF